MAINGNFKIEIGVTSCGFCVIGAAACNQSRDELDDTEKVYGVQIPHRLAALTPAGWRIMTPTEARKKGYTEIKYFPPKM